MSTTALQGLLEYLYGTLTPSNMRWVADHLIEHADRAEKSGLRRFSMEEVDAILDEAEIAKYSPEERREYEESVKNYWDYFSTMKTAEQKGEAKGMAQEKAATIVRLKNLGLSLEQIAMGVDLDIDQVNEILGLDTT